MPISAGFAIQGPGARSEAFLTRFVLAPPAAPVALHFPLMAVAAAAALLTQASEKSENDRVHLFWISADVFRRSLYALLEEATGPWNVDSSDQSLGKAPADTFTPSRHHQRVCSVSAAGADSY